MSKYVKKDFFNEWKKNVASQETNEEKKSNGNSNKWANPVPGLEYKIRFLPDVSGKNFYKKYFYHMFQDTDNQWKFSLCPKTFNMETYCPICSVVNKLYKAGTNADKVEAGRFKRKDKFVANIFVVSDPRDQDKDEDLKASGNNKLFEFATKLESIIRTQLLDAENGVGEAGFDPSDSGINFIIRVTETKPDDKGKKWPDYTTSAFARNATAIADSDEEVDDIMKKTIDLDKYLKDMAPDEEKIIEDLKGENVYDLIAEEYEKLLAKRNPKKQLLNDSAKKEVVETEDTSGTKLPPDESVEKEKPSKASKQEKDSKAGLADLDAELLAELNTL